MHRRGILSILILLLTTIVVEAPLIFLTVWLSFQFYMLGHKGLTFLGFNANSFHPYALNDAKLLQGRLYRANGISTPPSRTPGRLQVSSMEFNQDTDLQGQGTTIQSQELNYDPGWAQSVFGDADHLWLLGSARTNASGTWTRDIVKVEGKTFIPQAAMPWAQQRPIALSQETATGQNFEYAQSEALVLNGRLSSIFSLTPGHRELYQLIDGTWSSQGVIELLDVSRTWKNSAGETILEPIPPPPLGWSVAKDGLLEVLQVGTTPHLFWRIPEGLLYRRDFKFEKTNPPTGSGKQVPNGSDDDTPASAEQPANVDGMTDDWLVVSNDIPEGTMWFPAAANGEPAVVVISERKKGFPVARVLRLEDRHWFESPSVELPFSSFVLNLGSREDGSASYFAATTNSQRGGIYEVGPTGIRQTEIQYTFQPDGTQGYLIVYVLLVRSTIAALILVFIATLCMCRDRARYEFGHQSVELASVMERAIARAIDGILILLPIWGLIHFLATVWDFDWRTTAEAMQARVYDHPTFTVAFRIAVISLGSFVVLSLLYAAVQGRFTVTPGKWICRLRTVQTSLRPPGFSKSLLRELLLFVENLYLISWAPAILLIAFTSLRQRLGDRFADTIVVRARSLHQQSRPLIESLPQSNESRSPS